MHSNNHLKRDIDILNGQLKDQRDIQNKARNEVGRLMDIKAARENDIRNQKARLDQLEAEIARALASI